MTTSMTLIAPEEMTIKILSIGATRAFHYRQTDLKGNNQKKKKL